MGEEVYPGTHGNLLSLVLISAGRLPVHLGPGCSRCVSVLSPACGEWVVIILIKIQGCSEIMGTLVAFSVKGTWKASQPTISYTVRYTPW